MMKLYHAPASPFVRKVMVLIAELGKEDSVEVVATHATPVDSSQAPTAHNPLGKIPTLERDDGPALYDSRVICRYLDTVFEGGLYPPAPRLWDSLTLEATADGIMDAAVLMVYEGRVRPEELVYDVWVEAQWAKVTRALDALESRWIASLAGPLNIGQIAVACALGYLDFRHGARDWRSSRPQLTAWEKDFAARPAMVATQPAG